MSIQSAVFGPGVQLKCRGTVDTSQVNLNPLKVAINWGAVFDAEYALDVSSSSADDDGDPAGTGAQVVRILGLDKYYNRIYEDVTLNGTAIVTTATKFLRVFAAFVKTRGTGRKNAGDVYIVKTGTGGAPYGTPGVPDTLTSAVLKMMAGNNLAYSGLFTAPAGCYFEVGDLSISGRAQAGTILLVTGNETDTTFKGPFEILKVEVSQEGSLPLVPFHYSLKPKDDLYIQAFAAANGGIINLLADIQQTAGPKWKEV